MRVRTAIAITIATIAVLAASGAARAQAPQEDENLTALLAAEQVKATLLEKGGAKALPIRVTMDRATAILTGEVESKVIQELAKEVALSVDGVKKVDNRLRVAGEKPNAERSNAEASQDAVGELNDARLESAVKTALYREIGVRASKLEVEAVNGVVSVRGAVPDAARKQIVLDTLRARKDVKQVIDLMKVGG